MSPWDGSSYRPVRPKGGGKNHSLYVNTEVGNRIDRYKARKEESGNGNKWHFNEFVVTAIVEKLDRDEGKVR